MRKPSDKQSNSRSILADVRRGIRRASYADHPLRKFNIDSRRETADAPESKCDPQKEDAGLERENKSSSDGENRSNSKKPGKSSRRGFMLFPKACAPSVHAIDYESLAAAGCRGVIFDIDNTVVMDQQEATPEAIEFFARVRAAGLTPFILSNNSEERVKSFADAVGADYIYKAGKPGADGYLKAMEKMGTDASSTIFIGDQLFTDIWGANNAGVFSVLVQPVDPEEILQIRLKRILEKPLLLAYKMSRKKSL